MTQSPVVSVDAGPPEDLIDRHGRRATIRWTLAAQDRHSALIEELSGLDGVTDVATSGRHVEVRGDRGAIARVGAALVRTGAVPADLSVRIPSLEDALLALLDGAEQQPAPRSAEREPAGVGR